MCTSACLTVSIKSIRNSHAERFGSASEPTWKADGRQSRPLDGPSLTVHPSRVIEEVLRSTDYYTHMPTLEKIKTSFTVLQLFAQ